MTHALSEVGYRGMIAEDEPFIYSAWLKSVRNESPVYVNVPDRVFYVAHHAVIERLLPSSTVALACLRDDPSVLIGFAVAATKRDGIHFIYVKSAFRRMGIAKALIENLSLNIDKCFCTHWTNFLSQTQRAKWPGLVYDPYFLRLT